MDHQERRRAFIGRFADHWAAGGATRTEGLVAGYLMLEDSRGASGATLADALGISRGSVSIYTRQLIDKGFVRRRRRAGDRTHYYAMEADVWAGFLASEQQYLRDQRQLADDMLPLLQEHGQTWERVRNMRDYMSWMLEQRLGQGWETFKASRDDAAP